MRVCPTFSRHQKTAIDFVQPIDRAYLVSLPHSTFACTGLLLFTDVSKPPVWPLHAYISADSQHNHVDGPAHIRQRQQKDDDRPNGP
jgi:hypothetical protein